MDAKKALEDIYHRTPRYRENESTFTWSFVKNTIEGKDLIYAAFYNAAFSDGHSVCVNGYYTDQSQAILLMESLGGFYKQLTPNRAGLYQMYVEGLGDLTWETLLIVP